MSNNNSHSSTLNNINFPNSRTKTYLRQIENVIVGLLRNSPPSIVLKNYKKWENIEFSDRLRVKGENVSEKCIYLHHRNHRTTFMVVVRLLTKIYKLLLTNCCITRRELYYEEVQIIQCQGTINAAIQIICNLLDCPPWDIGIMATCKGLAQGPLLLKSGDNIFDYSPPGGTLIPFAVCSASVELRSSAKVVLLVEKDAMFQRLLNENIFDKLKNILLITGKGFPDVNTRILVRKLNHELKLPILALVDADPYGIAIMCTYKFGSLGMSRFSKFLATPDIKWLGIHPTDIDEYQLQTVALSQADFSKLHSLEKLVRLSISSHKDLLRQIQYLLQNGRKAEMEAICNISPNYLIDSYIPRKIMRDNLC